MVYREIHEFERTHAKMNRMAEVEAVCQTLHGHSEMTSQTIAEQCDVSRKKLQNGLLNELADYNVIKCVCEHGNGKSSTWTLDKPSNIERIRDDLQTGLTA